MFASQWVALIVTFVLALAWLRLNDFMAHRGWISGPLSRKIIHMGTGPVFVLCWLLFPETPLARYLAALIPLAITIQFSLVGLGVIKDQAAVSAMSRTGDRSEILRGPLLYGVVFVVLTLVYWKDSPIGIVALMLLCGGDGLADIIGKRVKSRSLPWSERKSLAGMMAMFAGGWLFSLKFNGDICRVRCVYWTMEPLCVCGYFDCTSGNDYGIFPYKDVDNLTVPFTAVVLGYLFF